MDRAALERALAAFEGFDDPDPSLEQYRTPADLAATLLHTAALRGDLAGRTVLDLGTGTGVLALGAAMAGADHAVGVERDPAALRVAARNATRVDVPAPVSWVLGDASRPPVAPAGPVTVVMNPPFGAQRGNEHADREFLAAAAETAAVSYSVHNAGSESFVDAFAADRGGRVTDAYRATFSMPRQFAFHEERVRDVDVEVFRVVWGDAHS